LEDLLVRKIEEQSYHQLDRLAVMVLEIERIVDSIGGMDSRMCYQPLWKTLDILNDFGVEVYEEDMKRLRRKANR
jgi:hypothetical protein